MSKTILVLTGSPRQGGNSDIMAEAFIQGAQSRGHRILRFDAGMKAINPAYENSREHYPFLHPKWSRDFTFHFAVGLPF